ncbi:MULTISPECIES: protease inhibitor I42 family protein [Citrobacter]|uniref:protease inhibitor I42 family protein n=1 Tax=Citrobacter TaxID=544 RepID=UPI0011EF70E9|nr:protease inhibitor I42 family protein [Citrobacter braakii]
MKKVSERMRPAGKVVSVILLSFSAVMTAPVNAAPENQSGKQPCDAGYTETETGDFSIPPVRTCLTHNTGVISMPVGTRFSVRFPDNPTTGLAWGLIHLPDSVMLISAEHTAPASCHTGMTGCDGEFISTFKAVTPGTGNIIFTHSRLWENAYPPAGTLTIHIQ